MIEYLRARPRAAWGGLVGLGLVTGALSALTFSLTGHGWIGTLEGFSPGLWYGILLAVYLAVAAQVGISRAVAFAVLVTAWWYVALAGALQIPGELGLTQRGAGEVVAGIVGGIIGGGGVAGTSALLFRPVRRPLHWAAIWAVGAVAGLLLALGNMFVLFCAWQALVAAALGYGLFGAGTAPAKG